MMEIIANALIDLQKYARQWYITKSRPELDQDEEESEEVYPSFTENIEVSELIYDDLSDNEIDMDGAEEAVN